MYRLESPSLSPTAHHSFQQLPPHHLPQLQPPVAYRLHLVADLFSSPSGPSNGCLHLGRGDRKCQPSPESNYGPSGPSRRAGECLLGLGGNQKCGANRGTESSEVRPVPQGASSALEDLGGVCVTLLATYLRNSSRRIWSRRFYDHEADGTFQRYCFSEVRAPYAARPGAGCGATARIEQ